MIEQNHNESNTEVLKTKRLRLENVTSKITSTAAVDPRHLNVEVADKDFSNCSYIINRTCQNPMLIM